MLDRWSSEDAYDARSASTATGALASFNAAGVLSSADVHVAERVCGIVGDTDDEIRLAVALTVRAIRHGSVCLRLDELDRDPDLTWPADGWLAKVEGSEVAAQGAIVVDDGAIYLARFHREETAIRDDLVARISIPEEPDAEALEAADRIFGPGFEEQRAAALAAATQSTTVITGGPGTGKTTTVAGLLALLLSLDPSSRVALAAPTGKAAARLQESIEQSADRLQPADARMLVGLTASTLHRLLGTLPGTSRFRHNRLNPLPHDVVIVDETSMVSLTQMSQLLEAMRPATRLILVGDPDQLASVEAGAVLADLVDGLSVLQPSAVQRLRTTHRFGGAVGELARAVREGDLEAVAAVLDRGGDATLVDDSDATSMGHLRRDLVRRAGLVRQAAVAQDPAEALARGDAHRLLCAHRDGPQGAGWWNRQIERELSAATGEPIGPGWGRDWYAGRPILVTSNDYGLGLFNGDTGVTWLDDGVLRVRVGARDLAPSRMTQVETVHAMTVHKSQGSQATMVTVVLPEADSPLATRELIYTAITRAQEKVRLVGSREALEAAIARPVRRASGLARRLSAD
jgi:exodeoxyribonuclease V alpha subunit